MLLALSAATLIAVFSAPARHLVYTFDLYTVTSSAPGVRTTNAGTIALDMLSVQPDTGTVVRVSEQSRARSTQPVLTCVTYGTGLVICDPADGVSIEEMSVLRLTGQNFLHGASLSGNRGWQFSETDGRAKEVNDFTISASDHGVFRIPFERDLRIAGADGYSTTTHGTIAYNADRSVAVDLTQEAVTHPNADPLDPISEHLSAHLQTDSLYAVQ